MKKHSKRKIFKQLWSYFSKNKSKIILIFILSLFSVVANIFATFLVGFGLEDIIKEPQSIDKIWIFISFLIIAYIISSTFNYTVAATIVWIANNVGFQIRKDLFHKLQKLPISYLDTQSTGDVMSKLTNDVEIVVLTLSQQTAQLFSGVITVFGVLIGMFILSPVLAAILLLVFPLMFVVIVVLLKRAQPFFAKKQKYTGKLNGFVEEYTAAQKVINLFSYQKTSVNKFEKINKELAESTMKSQLISGFIFPYNNFVNNFMLMFMTIISIIFITDPNIHLYSPVGLEGIGLIFGFIMMQRQFTMPISNFMSMTNQFQLAYAGSCRFFEILDAEEEISIKNNKKIKVDKAEVKFENLNFSYDDKKMIIKNLSFVAKPGTINAIVGSTGSGKTTLISLLTRFYEINSGKILIDDQDISTFSKHNIRKNLTVVLQDTFLFSETIRQNILYGNMKANEEDIINAAKNANAWHFIQQLPKGLDTILESDNNTISEGEKQLIAIARAFLSKSKIIILDEATSYVDTKTEKEIQEAMSNLMKGRTSFVIAHRLSTIKKSDNIIVMQHGELKEQGTHNQLLQKKQLYYNMINSGMPDED